MSLVQDHPSHQRLAAFLWGQLDDADQAAVESHIETCADCCNILREIPDSTVLGRLRGPEKPKSDPPVPQSRPARVPADLRDHPRYKIERFLGAGGMGLVFQAQHRIMERSVALKIIHRDLFRKKHAVERFRQEVKAAARLSHPNIVTAFDAEQAGETHFLVMEFVDGITLARLVSRRGPLAIAHACNYARQAALGLQHAFENGMVHRDIKPQNLMLTRKGQIKILDFGLARFSGVSEGSEEPLASSTLPGITSAGDIMGTPDYMAPEQYQDSRSANIRADIYSLGCTLYFLLTGQTPFVEGSSQTKVFSHRYFQPQPIAELRDDLPADVGEIVKKMMAKDPGQRYQTPAEVARALAPFAKPGPPMALEPTPVRETDPTPAVTDASRSSEPARSARVEKGLFLGRCPYCNTRVRAPNKALGASVRCPQCANFFTAVPEEESAATVYSQQGDSTRSEADSAPTFANEPAEPRPLPIPPRLPERQTPTILVAVLALLTLTAMVLFFVKLPFALIAILAIAAILLLWKWNVW